jgi:hypothetical protein
MTTAPMSLRITNSSFQLASVAGLPGNSQPGKPNAARRSAN